MINKPLALKLAPKSLDDVIGQKHLLGEDKILSNLVKNKKNYQQLVSISFAPGPPYLTPFLSIPKNLQSASRDR